MENIQVSDYGVTSKGDSIKKYTLTNKNGMKLEVITSAELSLHLPLPIKTENTKMSF
jgi:aldose 1-epimerase